MKECWPNEFAGVQQEETLGAPARADIPAILIVDDDPDLREALSESLTFEGYVTVSVANGQEAVAWLTSTARPAVILLDLMMPVMDGRTFLQQRAADAHLLRSPVIVLTAGGDLRTVRCLLDVDHCFLKTVPLQELLNVVRQVSLRMVDARAGD